MADVAMKGYERNCSLELHHGVESLAVFERPG
jgi:hypothetical protein